MSNITIEELNNTHDYKQYCELLKQLTAVNLDNFTKEQFNDQLTLIKSNPFHKIMVAIYDGAIVGTVTVLIEPKIIHDLSRVAHIEDVVVNSSHRSLGLGRILMEEAIKLSKEFNCYKIILDCSHDNAGFYEKFGFVKKELQMARYLD